MNPSTGSQVDDLAGILSLNVDQISDAELHAKLSEVLAGLKSVTERLSVKLCREQNGDEGDAEGPGENMFTAAQMEAMLRRETELRTCPETQAAYAAAERREDTDWMEVTDALQRQILREFGVAPVDEERALAHFRAGPYRYPELNPLAIYHKFQRSRRGDLREGDSVPAVQLLDPSSGAKVDLAALAAGPRPVVLLAGLLDEFAGSNDANEEKKEGRASFFGVYITEAHAQDEWPISSARCTPDGCPVIVNQARTDSDRANAAAAFAAAFNFRVPLLIDPIDNPFDAAFAPWPIRFYILQNGVVRYIAQPRGASYSPEELRTRLVEILGEGS